MRTTLIAAAFLSAFGAAAQAEVSIKHANAPDAKVHRTCRHLQAEGLAKVRASSADSLRFRRARSAFSSPRGWTPCFLPCPFRGVERSHSTRAACTGSMRRKERSSFSITSTPTNPCWLRSLGNAKRAIALSAIRCSIAPALTGSLPSEGELKRPWHKIQVRIVRIP